MPAVPLVVESTTTVVIGSGFSGLAVAAELSRRGVRAVVVDGMCAVAPGTGPVDRAGGLDGRADILRLLRHYAQSHNLDVRRGTRAVDLSRAPASDAPARPWVVRTPQGILRSNSIVLTRCTLNEVRRLPARLGVSLGTDLPAALRAAGLYLVGAGELAAPTTREILRQAKMVGQYIGAQGFRQAQSPAVPAA
ncbi:NAD(P)-binding protein [Specibacter cremeus]|uniref:NAD(P)-binding protein n=1 Tax=Specibacter cremeus TaxID=1629051 RepID=UPI000F76E7FC|nr:FAD/NAD(P)-binding oxidoreductase [Specibacter cremeus]